MALAADGAPVPAGPLSQVAAAAPAVATRPAASLTHDGLSLSDWSLDGDGVAPTVNGAAEPVQSAAR